MGSTLVAMHAVKDQAVIAHVGDSYLLRNGVLDALTIDHRPKGVWICDQRTTPVGVYGEPPPIEPETRTYETLPTGQFVPIATGCHIQAPNAGVFENTESYGEPRYVFWANRLGETIRTEPQFIYVNALAASGDLLAISAKESFVLDVTTGTTSPATPWHYPATGYAWSSGQLMVSNSSNVYAQGDDGGFNRRIFEYPSAPTSSRVGGAIVSRYKTSFTSSSRRARRC